MTLLDDRIPEVLARVEVDDLVRRHGGVEARRTGNRIIYHCPHPSHEDGHPSFDTYDPPGGAPRRWACRSLCGRSGDAIEFLVWIKGCTKAEAIDELAAEVGMERPPRSARGTHGGGRPVQPVPVSARPTIASAEHDLLCRWCRRRGWGPWVIQSLGLSVVVDQFGRRRCRFPFRLADHGVPYHQDRALHEDARVKWLSPKGQRPILYEADRLRLARQRGAVLVVEGVTDVAAVVDVYTNPAVVGVPGASAWRARWAPMFRDLAVLVVTDDDSAGSGLRERIDTDLAPVARSVQHAFVPESHTDLADWRVGLEPGEFDRQFMAAVEAAAGDRSWCVAG